MLRAEPKHLVESLQSPDSCGGRASLLGGRNRETQQRRPTFVPVYGTLQPGAAGRGTQGCCGDGGLLGQVVGSGYPAPAQARLPRPSETEPILGPSSHRGSRDAILHASRTQGRGRGSVGLHHPSHACRPAGHQREESSRGLEMTAPEQHAESTAGG